MYSLFLTICCCVIKNHHLYQANIKLNCFKQPGLCLEPYSIFWSLQTCLKSVVFILSNISNEYCFFSIAFYFPLPLAHLFLLLLPLLLYYFSFPLLQLCRNPYKGLWTHVIAPIYIHDKRTYHRLHSH